jgi:hypothetical protein
VGGQRPRGAATPASVPAVVRAWRREAGGDAPVRLLALAVTGLPESHRGWGRAMCAELETVRDGRRRGAPDLATLAVSDALAGALTLLILIPLTALAFGSLGARTATSAPPHPAPRS